MNLEEAKKHLERYQNERCKPGAFIRAVLENNLFSTLRTADPESLENLREITNYVWNELPGNIWGSPAVVQAHLDKGDLQESAVGTNPT